MSPSAFARRAWLCWGPRRLSGSAAENSIARAPLGQSNCRFEGS
jgi:hypothetical protein